MGEFPGHAWDFQSLCMYAQYTKEEEEEEEEEEEDNKEKEKTKKKKKKNNNNNKIAQHTYLMWYVVDCMRLNCSLRSHFFFDRVDRAYPSLEPWSSRHVISCLSRK